MNTLFVVFRNLHTHIQSKTLTMVGYYALYCTLLYSILYFCFLSTSYVEGDDARTVLYHLMGRNPYIQAPYSPYHSGFDFYLSFFHSNEPLLRNVVMMTSFVFGGLVLFLTGCLLISVIPLHEPRQLIYLMLVPFIVPEFFFNSAYYNPTNIGFSFALGAALALVYYLRSGNKNLLLLYAALFGIAVPFRWSLVFMMSAYAGLFLYQTQMKPSGKQLKEWLFFSFLGIVLVFGCIAITGYSPKDTFNTLTSITEFTAKSNVSYLSLFANITAYYSFPFLTCILLSIIVLTQNKPELKRITLFLLFCLLPHVFMLLISGFKYAALYMPLFKYSITIMPALILLGYSGFRALHKKTIYQYSFYLVITFIWFCGIQIESTGMAYGPGFETKKHIYNKQHISSNPDNRVVYKQAAISCNAGLLMPTSDGPRPLLGYFYVIFGGKWKNVLTDWEHERQKLLQLVQTKQYLLYQDSRTAYLQCDLYRMGYSGSAYSFNNEAMCYSRYFSNTKDSLQLHIIPPVPDKTKWIIQQQKRLQKPILLYSIYSNQIAELAEKKNTTILGTYSILLL